MNTESPLYIVLQKLIRYRNSLKLRSLYLIESTVSSSDGEEGDVSQLIEPKDGVITELNTFIYQFVNLGNARQFVGE